MGHTIRNHTRNAIEVWFFNFKVMYKKENQHDTVKSLGKRILKLKLFWKVIVQIWWLDSNMHWKVGGMKGFLSNLCICYIVLIELKCTKYTH
jgi:hypothetical protein